MTRLALIADIHSNALALEAVLADIRHRGVDQIYDLGDVAQGSLAPPRPSTTCRLRGSHPYAATPIAYSWHLSQHLATNRTLPWPTALSPPADWDWLAAQPPHRRVGSLFLCHGTPSSDTKALLETIGPTGADLANDDEIADRLKVWVGGSRGGGRSPKLRVE